MNILISGTPGTGKSEVSEALGKKLSMKVVHVSDLVDDFSVGTDEKRDTKIVDEDKLGKKLREFQNVIIETHLPIKVDARCFVLRCDISELKERLTARKWSEEKINENIQAEIFNSCSDDMKNKGYEIIEIDTTGKSAEETAERITCILGK